MYENGSSFAEGYAIGRDSSNGGFGSGMFGGDWAWWIVILLIFGWGGNGGFGRGGYGGGAANDYVLVSDFAQIERKLDTLSAGICDSTFALNNTIVNGFNNTNNALLTQGYETRNAISGLSSQLAGCCCDIEKSILENRYIDAQHFAGLSNTICGATRDIIDNANANYRAIHDELIANKIEAKNERIAEQQATITALQLKASQEAQNNYLLSELKPCPRPAYITCNPYQSYPFYAPVSACGCGCASVQ